MKDLFKDWKVHALCLAMTVVAELIATQKFVLFGKFGVSLFPMLYALILGILLAIFNTLFCLLNVQVLKGGILSVADCIKVACCNAAPTAHAGLGVYVHFSAFRALFCLC